MRTVTRTGEILRAIVDRHHRRIDKMFVVVLLAQWLFGVVLASLVSPYAYAGTVRSTHFHVELAFFFGAIINVAPIALVLLRPGHAITRHTIAVVQILWSAILITITNGRIETHFHIFGSLAFLALYRDWRVLVTATVMVLLDHVVRGQVWPQALYGIADPQAWRILEHAGWIVFEDIVLVVASVRSLKEMRQTARDQAALELVNAGIERKVESRTRALSDAKDRFRALVENIEAVPFEYDVAMKRLLYIAPQASRILHRELGGDVLFGTVYPEDSQRVDATMQALGAGALKAASFDYRVLGRERQIVHLRVVASARGTNLVQGVAIDITKQANLELELRQAQKLESVGRLAAGVAHEINTPIQFVNDSVRFLQTAVEDMLIVVDKHHQATLQTLDGCHELGLARAALAAELAVDMPFLSQAMPEAIGRAVVGIDRVAAIVRSIKAFAHPDAAEMAYADLNEAIDSTLVVASAETKHVADVETVFGEIPDVLCHVGEINQVVLNLVVNAAHAIGERGGDTLGRITVTTRAVGTNVEISVEDTGGGIPEHIRHRIFDPFFTTKEVGAGTGQGLAIAHSVVVDKHRGKLTFDSTVGEGTTFVIVLPIEQQLREAA
jgi:signal transduction histidine kinase